MGIARYLAVILVAVPAIAVSAPPVMDVEEVIDQHHALSGKTVRVKGWLTVCQPLSCWISSRNNKRAPHLSIGDSRSFDREVASLIGQKITLEAQLNPKCLHVRVDPPNDRRSELGCLDRGDELANPIFLHVN
jgi:hypothetical protein